jgi:hypothetical protein
VRAELTFEGGDSQGELGPLLSRLGVEGGARSSKVGLKLNGQRVVLELDFVDERLDDWNDTPRVRSRARRLHGVDVLVRFEGVRGGSGDGAPCIELRRETSTDQRDKRTGLVREVQTGFAGFDRAVFIDNDASEADVRRILSKEATRQAVLRLLDAGHPCVRFTPASVSVRHLVSGGAVNPDGLLETLEDLLVVARAGGPRDAVPARRGERLRVLIVAGAALGAAYAGLLWVSYRPSVLPLFVGAVVGGIAGFFLRPWLEARSSGDSGSGARAWQATAGAMVAVGGLTAGALQHLNVALDSTGELAHGVVSQVLTERRAVGQGRPSSLDVEALVVRFRDGEEQRVPWSSPAHVGDRYVETRHRGALGFEWVSDRQLNPR